MNLTIYTARCTGNKANCIYPDRREVSTAEELAAAAKLDHVCAEYQNNYRSRENFICSDTVVMDCDSCSGIPRKHGRALRR